MGQASRVITVYNPDWVAVKSYLDDDDEYPIQVLIDQGRLILRRPAKIEHEVETWRTIRAFQLLGNYAPGFSVQVERRFVTHDDERS